MTLGGERLGELPGSCSKTRWTKPASKGGAAEKLLQQAVLPLLRGPRRTAWNLIQMIQMLVPSGWAVE